MKINFRYSIIFYISICYSININAQVVDRFYGLNLKVNRLFTNEYIPAMEKEGDLKKSSKPMGERKDFAPDGLRPRRRGISSKWESQEIKLMFLFKDANGHTDARNYEVIKGRFLQRVSKLVVGFSEVTKNGYPPQKEITHKWRHNVFNSYPHAYINIKKKVGGSRVSNSLVSKYARRYKKYTLKEIEILQPNVILCGGTFNIAKDILFKDYQIEKICERMYYSKSKNIIIIDSYHPAASVTNYEMYDLIFDNFIKAINIISKKYNHFSNI